MFDFSERQKQIIEALARSQDYLTCAALGKRIGYSRRTIINDIQDINRQLPLILSTNRGYLLDSAELKKIEFISTPQMTDEHVLLRRLVMRNKDYTLAELAEKQFVSESTMEKKLKALGPLLASFDLSIKREKGFVKVVGNEYSKRKFINHIISEETEPTFSSLENIADLLSSLNVTRIKEIIDHSIQKYQYYVDKNYSFNLYLNIMIALYRMKSEIYIDQIPHHTIQSHSIEYRIAQEICGQYSNHWKISPQEEDIIYIALLLTGQIKPVVHNGNVNSCTLEIISKEFIGKMDNILFETFNYYMMSVNYKDFLYNFSLHIDAMIKRIKNHQSVSNDLLENVKKNCPFIYEVSVHIAQKISLLYTIEIPDEEIGFISVHIGFLINGSVENYNRIKILLLCNDYHHIIDNIKERIINNHSEYVSITAHDISSIDSKIDLDVDLIVSTKFLNVIGKRLVVITPFYTMMDHIQVDAAIHEAILEKEMAFKNQLLSSFFHESLFFKTNQCQTKEEVIRFLGDKVIEFGLAAPGFTESVLARESLSSTCFFESFAIPHSLDQTTKQSMFCVLISEEGILWDENHIHIVLMLAIQFNDRKEFMNIYNGIIRTLWEKDKIEPLVKANNLIEFLSLLR